MANFTIISEQYINKPPAEVGDFSINVNNRVTTTLTANMFTTSTNPPYLDPEGDPAVDIRIDSLPLLGQLQFNNNPVTVGQIISISDINLGLLKYVSPDENLATTAQFNFSVRDSGSMQFTS